MAKPKKGVDEGASYYDKWYAGVDHNDDSWRGDWRGQRMSRDERDQARRWARGQKPRGGIIRRLLG